MDAGSELFQLCFRFLEVGGAIGVDRTVYGDRQLPARVPVDPVADELHVVKNLTKKQDGP